MYYGKYTLKEEKMKLLFKQRLFSWFDSYDIYDEAGETVFLGTLP